MTDDERWQAVRARDASADGLFVFAVSTTGVYCRPGCPARTPKRKNVRFFLTREGAEMEGFRPCKRCTPDALSPEAHRVETAVAACRTIEAAEAPVPLAQLAADAGMSPYHFHRIFKSVIGVTPKAYATSYRGRALRDRLSTSETVTEAAYESGFNSTGRFYAAAEGTLGMTPSDFQAGGKNETIRFAIGASSLGGVLVAATAKGLCALLLGDEPQELKRELAERFPKARLVSGDRAFEKLAAKAIKLVDDPARVCDLPLDIRGTAFQQKVWQALRDIPAGETASYTEVAEKIGKPSAVRAVAGACAANHLSVIIPCHRVLRSDGSLSGYYWGVDRKKALLKKEKGE